MKSEIFSEAELSLAREEEKPIQFSKRKMEESYRNTGFRLCPCKLKMSHSHSIFGAWCDIPDNFFSCLPEGEECYDVGLCRFKTNIPGIFRRIISREEVAFLLKRSILIQKLAYRSGASQKRLRDEYNEHSFPRGILT